MTQDVRDKWIRAIVDRKGIPDDAAERIIEKDLESGKQSFAYCPRDEFKYELNCIRGVYDNIDIEEDDTE